MDTEEPEVDIPVEHHPRSSGSSTLTRRQELLLRGEDARQGVLGGAGRREDQVHEFGRAAAGARRRKRRRRRRQVLCNAGMVILAIILPIGLPFLALFYCYWAASKEGLGDVLAMLRKKRDRSAKRRGTKAGGNFRQRQKTSQDGKGGRSANS